MAALRRSVSVNFLYHDLRVIFALNAATGKLGVAHIGEMLACMPGCRRPVDAIRRTSQRLEETGFQAGTCGSVEIIYCIPPSSIQAKELGRDVEVEGCSEQRK